MYTNNRSKRILMIDDSDLLEEGLSVFLRDKGYEVNKLNNKELVFARVHEFMPHIVFLCLSSPDDAIVLCSQLQKKMYIRNHVFFLSQVDDEELQVSAFNAGAKDFLLLPLRERPLLKRIEESFRRFNIKFINVGPLSINPYSYNVLYGDKKVVLTKKEFDLLYFLAQHPNKIYKRQELFDIVWNKDPLTNDRTVDVHINRLRDKIGRNMIETIIRVGYKFTVN
jgi:two-component system alkaline phosphatase synthesis response regulator PhoP